LNGIIRVPKDKNNVEECRGVVYRVDCNDCDASYVGQTGRQLGTRMKEHKVNIKLDPSRNSVISEHILQFDHLNRWSFKWNNVKILDNEHNFYKRLTSEIIHIKDQKNGINSQKDSESFNSVYTDILSELAIR